MPGLDNHAHITEAINEIFGEEKVEIRSPAKRDPKIQAIADRWLDDHFTDPTYDESIAYRI